MKIEFNLQCDYEECMFKGNKNNCIIKLPNGNFNICDNLILGFIFK